MKLLQANLHGRARALIEAGASMRSASEVLALETKLPLPEVEEAVAAAFARFQGTEPDPAPPPVGAAGSRAADLLQRERAGPLRLDPLATLSPRQRARLSLADRASIARALRALEHEVQARGLTSIPVFGYLSLRTRNADVFGKPQTEVRPGVDVVDASLPGWNVGVVLSTLYRGSPEHPGAVAGLTEDERARTPGSVLHLPLAQADDMLARLIAREMIGESDLDDRAGHSNGMYIPRVLDVTLADGNTIPALVFVTNPDGAKDPQRVIGESLSVGQLAYFMLGAGGFVAEDGTRYGGRSVDYWQESYVGLKRALAEPVDETIAAAIHTAHLVAHGAVSEALLPSVLGGSFVPLDTVHLNRDLA